MKPLNAALALLSTCLALSAQAVGRLADLSIYDRSTGQELPVHWHEGRAYVVGRPGNEYQVVVRNRIGGDLLTVVSVDGVNVVSGETASPGQAGYVLDGWRETRIAGWRKSLSEIAAFYFTSLPDSYAGRTGRPGNVGVIGVAVFQRREPLPPPPAELSMQPSPQEPWQLDKRAEQRSGPAAPLGTGHGRRESSEVRHVDFQRRTREPVETIAIYYDSYRNLVAQGVLAAPVARRDPNPFPTTFVRDP